MFSYKCGRGFVEELNEVHKVPEYDENCCSGPKRCPSIQGFLRPCFGNITKLNDFVLNVHLLHANELLEGEDYRGS